jgi:hypothetical protein
MPIFLNVCALKAYDFVFLHASMCTKRLIGIGEHDRTITRLTCADCDALWHTYSAKEVLAAVLLSRHYALPLLYNVTLNYCRGFRGLYLSNR